MFYESKSPLIIMTICLILTLSLSLILFPGIAHAEDRGEIEIQKVDNHGQPMEGVQFILTDEEGNEIILITDYKGKTSVGGLEFGDYNLREVVPVGYDPEEVEIDGDDIDEDGDFIIDSESESKLEFDVINYEIPGVLKITKYDSTVTTKPLEGAEFSLEIYDEKQGVWVKLLDEDDEIITEETDDEGIAEFEDLKWGLYRIIEIKGPDGYKKSTLQFQDLTGEVLIGAESTEVSVIAYNTKGITKGESDDSSSVLGDTENPDNKVLGADAKTDDPMNNAFRVILMLILMSIITVWAIKSKKEL